MSTFTDELSGFMALLNPWAGLFVQAVSMVESLAAQSPAALGGTQKKSAAVDAVVQAITMAPAVTAEVTNLQTALKTNDPATVSAGLGQAVEVALSVSKTFGLFPKAGVVQSAAPLATAAGANTAPQ